ncbi:MAG: hypothetical protein Cons2KO_17670 [Congregibacter sp.]
MRCSMDSVLIVPVIVPVMLLASIALAQGEAELYRAVPMPAGIRVVATELEGPVFATTSGKTLYEWKQHKLRNGYSGEAAGKVACLDEVQTVTAGLMSPYPPGIELPDIATRPSCTDIWQPALLEEQSLTGDDLAAEKIGDWVPIERPDGSLQWTYKEQPLYTYVRDKAAGDTLGGTTRRRDGDAPASRSPIGPPADVPPGFTVKTSLRGSLLTTDSDQSVYASDNDTPESTQCHGECLRDWEPLIAPAMARPRAPWSLIERSPGVRQWVFRGEPLYTYKRDSQSWSQEGSDVEGWHNVYLQTAPAYPSSFTVQDSLSGEVLADARGRTIYLYQCGEDSLDQLGCDHPDDTQVYRFAMCGAGDPQRCLTYWPYVEAAADASAPSRAWTVLSINPMTGKRVAEGAAGSLRVWAYRLRPVYTFYGDQNPGDVHGGGTGEWRGKRNGLLAFWLRNDLMRSGL